MARLYTLPPAYARIVTAVDEFGQITSSQIRRLCYTTGTPGGRVTRSNRALKRLYELGKVDRIDRAVGGYTGGSGEFIYRRPDLTGRPDEHALARADFCIQLTESDRVTQLFYWVEAEAYRTVGHNLLKPDIFIELRVGGVDYAFMVEIDMGTEHKKRIGEKLNGYVNAYKSGYWKDGPFPPIIWACKTEKARREIKRKIGLLDAKFRGLFDVYIFDEAIEVITGAAV